MTVKHKIAFAAFGLIMVSFLIPALGQLPPSDMIMKQPAPAAIDLRNVDPLSLSAIGGSMQHVGQRVNWEIANFGRYSSTAVKAVQSENESIDPTLQKFAQGEGGLPANVGNATGNITEINGTMVWS